MTSLAPPTGERRAGARITLSCGSTPQLSRALATRWRLTRSGASRAKSRPGRTILSRGGATGKTSAARSAANCEAATTRSPSCERRFEARARPAGRTFAGDRRDHRQFQLPAGPERDPGGGARARMDEIDPFRLEDAREPADVERHRERIVAGGGERQVQASDRLNLARRARPRRSRPARALPPRPARRRSRASRPRPRRRRAAGRAAKSSGRRAARRTRVRTGKADRRSRRRSPAKSAVDRARLLGQAGGEAR